MLYGMKSNKQTKKNWQFFVPFLRWLRDTFERLSDLQLGVQKGHFESPKMCTFGLQHQSTAINTTCVANVKKQPITQMDARLIRRRSSSNSTKERITYEGKL